MNKFKVFKNRILLISIFLGIASVFTNPALATYERWRELQRQADEQPDNLLFQEAFLNEFLRSPPASKINLLPYFSRILVPETVRIYGKKSEVFYRVLDQFLTSTAGRVWTKHERILMSKVGLVKEVKESLPQNLQAKVRSPDQTLILRSFNREHKTLNELLLHSRANRDLPSSMEKWGIDAIYLRPLPAVSSSFREVLYRTSEGKLFVATRMAHGNSYDRDPRHLRNQISEEDFDSISAFFNRKGDVGISRLEWYANAAFGPLFSIGLDFDLYDAAGFMLERLKGSNDPQIPLLLKLRSNLRRTFNDFGIQIAESKIDHEINPAIKKQVDQELKQKIEQLEKSKKKICSELRKLPNSFRNLPPNIRKVITGDKQKPTDQVDPASLDQKHRDAKELSAPEVRPREAEKPEGESRGGRAR